MAQHLLLSNEDEKKGKHEPTAFIKIGLDNIYKIRLFTGSTRSLGSWGYASVQKHGKKQGLSIDSFCKL